MSKLLIVSDEEYIRSMIRKYGEFEGHEIEEAVDGMDAVEKCKQAEYDLIAMDIMMPNLNGFSAIKETRKDVQTPVIMLSVRGKEYDRVHGFEVGVDSYVVKPFSPEELAIRISAILKRYHDDVNTGKRNVYTYGGLKIDFTIRKASIDNKEMEMPPKEYVLLFYLAHSEGTAPTRKQLIHDVWGYDFYGDDRTLGTYIELLRRSLQGYSRPITTPHEVRYRSEAKK